MPISEIKLPENSALQTLGTIFMKIALASLYECFN